MLQHRTDIAQITLSVLFIAILIGTSVWILSPFLLPLAWATTLVIATWPVMLRIQNGLGGSRVAATGVMTILVVACFLFPFWLALSTILDNSTAIVGWVGSLATARIGAPPEWVAGIPLIGSPVAKAWAEFASGGLNLLLDKARPYAGSAAQWLLSAAGNIGLTFLQFILTALLAAVMYLRGEAAAAAVLRFGARLAGSRGESSVKLAARAIRGVAMGVVVTALIQASIGGAGLAIANVPFAGLLSAVLFVLCIAQIGPAPVLVPAVIWMFAVDRIGAGVFLAVASVLSLGIDNVIRPVLIRRGADLPIFLILAGVIGGILGFGLIGLFLGPTVLAIAYALLGWWMNEETASSTRVLVESTTVSRQDGNVNAPKAREVVPEEEAPGP